MASVSRGGGATPSSVVTENAGLDDRLTAREQIAYYGALHGLSRPALNRRIDVKLVNLLG